MSSLLCTNKPEPVKLQYRLVEQKNTASAVTEKAKYNIDTYYAKCHTLFKMLIIIITKEQMLW